jgi:hypothetical protein
MAVAVVARVYVCDGSLSLVQEAGLASEAAPSTDLSQFSASVVKLEHWLDSELSLHR